MVSRLTASAGLNNAARLDHPQDLGDPSFGDGSQGVFGGIATPGEPIAFDGSATAGMVRTVAIPASSKNRTRIAMPPRK
jgi:hypothetical protein